MWTIATYAWKYDTGKPERLWSAERIRFDANNGIEWWNNDTKSYIDEFFDYDIGSFGRFHLLRWNSKKFKSNF